MSKRTIGGVLYCITGAIWLLNALMNLLWEPVTTGDIILGASFLGLAVFYIVLGTLECKVATGRM